MGIMSGQEKALRPKRQSIEPTYDSRETGDRYHVTYKAGSRVVEWEKRMPDPFGRFTLTLGWRDLLRGLVRRRLAVEVLVGADPDVMNDVLELDSNCLIPNSTRRDEFNAGIQSAIRKAG